MTGNRSVRLVARLALACVAMVALSSCVRLTSDTSFSDHDTLDQVIVIALEPAAAAQAGFDTSLLTADGFSSLITSDAFPEGKFTIEDYTDGDLKGVRIEIDDATFDESNSLSLAIASGTQGVLGSPIVSRDGDEYIISMEGSQALGNSQFSELGGLAGLAGNVDVAITFTFPGPAHSTTAGKLDGKTVTLGLDELLSGKNIEIRGSAKDEIAWEPILRWTGIGAVGLIIIGGAAWLMWREGRKRRTSSLPPIPQAPEEPSSK